MKRFLLPPLRPSGLAAAALLLAGALSPTLTPAQTPEQTATPTAGEFSPGARFAAREGESLYATACMGCHMRGGTGAAGAAKYPPLAGNDKLASAGYATFMVMRGQKAMPGFSEQLSDAQVAAVVNYVRSSFGNAWSDRVNAADAAALR